MVILFIAMNSIRSWFSILISINLNKKEKECFSIKKYGYFNANIFELNSKMFDNQHTHSVYSQIQKKKKQIIFKNQKIKIA